MKPAAFAYEVPHTLEEALHSLAKRGPDAKILAGGQSLIRLMNARTETPGVLVDITRIPDQDRITIEDGVVRIGALVTQRASEISSIVREHIPLFSEAGAEVAHVSVRERGTVLGSLAFADPCAELPTALVALGGEVVARSVRGERRVAADDLFIGPHRTALDPDEVLVEARIPAQETRGGGSSFLEVTRRHGELPVCGVAAVVVLDEDRRVTSARIAVGGAGDHPVRVMSAEQALLGTTASANDIRGAAELAALEIVPRPTVHGSAAFRTHLVSVVTRRALERAVERATERTPS